MDDITLITQSHFPPGTTRTFQREGVNFGRTVNVYAYSGGSPTFESRSNVEWQQEDPNCIIDDVLPAPSTDEIFAILPKEIIITKETASGEYKGGGKVYLHVGYVGSGWSVSYCYKSSYAEIGFVSTTLIECYCELLHWVIEHHFDDLTISTSKMLSSRKEASDECKEKRIKVSTGSSRGSPR